MIFNRGNSNVDLEVLLKNEASKYRMYPSEKIWDNIRDEIQPKTKWPALITIFVSIVLALTISTIINYPVDKVGTYKLTSAIANNVEVVNSKNLNSGAAIFLSQNLYNKKSINKPTTNSIKFSTSKNEINSFSNTEKNIVKLHNDEIENINSSDVVFLNEPEKIRDNEQITDDKNVEEVNNDGSAVSDVKIDILNFIKKDDSTTSVKANLNENGLVFHKKNKNILDNKWRIQYYVTFSNSFRTLHDDKSRSNYLSSLTDRAALNKNVNDVVIQKPMLGAEIGGAVLYKLTKNLYLKAGLQFDIRQYNIDAFNAYGAANINYINNNQLNTYSAISGFSTNAENALGAKTNLQNKLYELSVPVGLEWDIVNGQKWGLSVSGTIQPTVALNRSNFIVSTDYKYYTDASPFFRRYNVNANTGLFFTLKTKNLKWFLGPQVRFQQLPTYNDLYPIKEYRIDYGVKIGFTKPLY
jgi:hypothetical protein